MARAKANATYFQARVALNQWLTRLHSPPLNNTLAFSDLLSDTEYDPFPKFHD